MLTVSSSDFQKNPAKYHDAALTEPVAITQNGREKVVLLSAETFREMQRCSREVLPVEALTGADIAAIAKAEASAEARRFDHELDQ
jgi:prevent-host-death family protein